MYWHFYNTSSVSGVSSSKIYNGYNDFEETEGETEIEEDKRAFYTRGRESLRHLQQSCVTSYLFFRQASGGCFGAESDEFLYRTGLQKERYSARYFVTVLVRSASLVVSLFSWKNMR